VEVYSNVATIGVNMVKINHIYFSQLQLLNTSYSVFYIYILMILTFHKKSVLWNIFTYTLHAMGNTSVVMLFINYRCIVTSTNMLV
jgi:hypothetical protein